MRVPDVLSLTPDCDLGFQMPEGFTCGSCERTYNHQRSLRRHIKLECGKDAQFPCPYCQYKAKQRNNVKLHIHKQHQDLIITH